MFKHGNPFNDASLKGATYLKYQIGITRIVTASPDKNEHNAIPYQF